MFKGKNAVGKFAQVGLSTRYDSILDNPHNPNIFFFFFVDVLGTGLMNNLESNNNNSMMSHGNSESGSESNSPLQYSISPSQPVQYYV